MTAVEEASQSLQPVADAAPKASHMRLMGGSVLYHDAPEKDVVSPILETVKTGSTDSPIQIVATATAEQPVSQTPTPTDGPNETFKSPVASPAPAKAEQTVEEPEQNTDSSMVVMPREQAWINLLAYEACLQVCIKAVIDGAPEAGGFLQDSCNTLKQAFDCSALVLRPPEPGEPANVAGGATISWSETSQEYMPPVRGQEILLVAQVAGISPHQLKDSTQLGKTDKLFISLHASSQPKCSGSDVVEMTAGEQTSTLHVEVHNEQGLIATGAIPISSLWQLTEQATKAETAAVQPKAKGNRWSLMNTPKDAIAAVPAKPAPTQVEVLDKDGKSVGTVAIAGVIQQPVQAPHVPKAAAVESSSGPVDVNTWQVYQKVLETALAEQGCGARNLALGGPWRWLLKEVAAAYGVRPTFAALAFLKWAAGPGRLTPTADCLSMLAQELRPLKRAEPNLLPQEKAILDEVTAACEALLAHTFEGYHSLSEKEECGLLSGGASGPESPAPAISPAVRLYGILKEDGRLRDQVWLQDRLRVAAGRRYHRLHRNCVKRITEHGYLVENKRHGRLAPIEEGGKADAETLAYRRLEALCESIRAEVENDRLIAEHGVFPPFLDLPAVTAPEYCQELENRINEVLRAAPPLKPVTAAVDLLLAVGRLQDYVGSAGARPAPGARGALDAPALFAPYIHRWIDASKDALCKKVQKLEMEGETSSPKKKSGPAILPLVPAMLAAVEAELASYQRIISHWPQFGPAVEAAACTALRDTVLATSRQCGLFQQQAKPMSPPPVREAVAVTASPRKLFGRKAKPAPPAVVVPPAPKEPTARLFTPVNKRDCWQWRVPAGLENSASVVQGTVAPHEALLLNSLRELLSAAPAMEATLSNWCASGRHSRRTASASLDAEEEEGKQEDEYSMTQYGEPEIGAHFLQVVGELRSQYAVGVKLAAQRLAGAVFDSEGAAPAAILDKLWEAIGPVRDSVQPYWQRLSQPADPKLNSQQHVAPLLKVLGDTVKELGVAVDGRVWVALTRGLWELSSKEIFDYLEGLHEAPGASKNAWRSRQNAALMLDHVDAFFRDSISTGPAAGWQNGLALSKNDLERPFHSEKAHKLLANNTTDSNLSFNPY